MCSSWEMSVFQLLVISKFTLTQAASGNTSPRCCYSCMMKCTSCPSGTSSSNLVCEEAIETILGLGSESHKELFLHNSPCADSRMFTNIERFWICWHILRLSFDLQGSQGDDWEEVRAHLASRWSQEDRGALSRVSRVPGFRVEEDEEEQAAMSDMSVDIDYLE